MKSIVRSKIKVWIFLFGCALSRIISVHRAKNNANKQFTSCGNPISLNLLTELVWAMSEYNEIGYTYDLCVILINKLKLGKCIGERLFVSLLQASIELLSSIGSCARLPCTFRKFLCNCSILAYTWSNFTHHSLFLTLCMPLNDTGTRLMALY